MKTIVLTVSAVLVITLLSPAPPARAQIDKNDLHIGLLLDFDPDATGYGSGLAQLQEEILRVVGADREVHFLPGHRRFTTGRGDRIASDYGSLADDPTVDLIIAAGAVSPTMLAAQGPLSKPTIAVGILDAELHNMPLVDPGVTGVRNFTYVLSAGSIQKDMAFFHHIHPLLIWP